MLWPCDYVGERCGSLSSALDEQDSVSIFNGMLKALNDSRYDVQVGSPTERDKLGRKERL